MSSGTRPDPAGANRAATGAAGKFLERNRNLGMTPRQQRLNHLWARYTCCQYAARRVDWNGLENTDPVETEGIATAGFLPGGFYDAGQSLPLRFRRPSAPYHLAKVVVDRFTGLLFSEKRHPELRAEGDADTEDFVHALAESSRLWAAFIQARTIGGAQGSVAVGFQFLDGRPVVDVHDPRWLIPRFKDRLTLELKSLEKRFMYPEEERDPETGEWVEVWYWYRRVIDENADTLYARAPVGDGEEPAWYPEKVVEHGFGWCPVKWIQNLPVLDDVDGEPDCHGIGDMCDAIDALLSQAHKGAICNSDPTVVIATDAAMAEVRKGSDNAIKVPAGGTATYLEMTGAGPKAALDQAEVFRRYALEVAQCVLEHPDTTTKTATEVDRGYSSMHAKTDVLREQYGQKGVLQVVEMMVRAARQLAQPRPAAAGPGLQVGVLALPPKVVRSAGADGVSQVRQVARRLGAGGVLKLQWPDYVDPTPEDAESSVRTAAAALGGQLVDHEHAVKSVARYFGVEDVPAALAKIRAERHALQSEFETEALAGMPGFGGARAAREPPGAE